MGQGGPNLRALSYRQQRAASWGPKKFQAFGATWVAYTCPPWLANAPLLPLAMPLASATQTPPGPGGSPASTRCRRHLCSRPRATAWAQRGAKVSHLGGRGCAPEVWAPAVATQRVHWHPTPQAWQNGLFAGAPWCPNGAVSCATSPRRPQKFHGPRHKPPGWQRKPQAGPRPRRGRPCGGTAPPPQQRCSSAGPHPPRGPKWHWARSGAAHKPPKWQGGGAPSPRQLWGAPRGFIHIVVGLAKTGRTGQAPETAPSTEPGRLAARRRPTGPPACASPTKVSHQGGSGDPRRLLKPPWASGKFLLGIFHRPI